jgi:hypothetical protein
MLLSQQLHIQSKGIWKLGTDMATKSKRKQETKTDALYARLTPTAKAGLKAKAAQLGIPLAEMLELIGRDQILVSPTR